MEALIPLVALVALALLAIRFGADSRPAIRSHEHRLADAGVVWDAPARPAGPDAVTADRPAIRHLPWAPMLAAHSGMASSPFPTLQAIDRALDPGQPLFATDPDAEFLEDRARHLIDQHWSEHVWRTGFVDQSRFALVRDALERDRQSRSRVEVVVAFEHPSSIAS